MASLSTPYPLFASSSSSAPSHTYTSPVRNTSNEVVVAVDGQGVSIHIVAPNRIISAYSVGLDVKFLCAPISIRKEAGVTVTWFLCADKGDTKLICWTQNGVESMENTIAISSPTSTLQSLLAFDENSSDYVVVSFDNSHLECYKCGESAPLWKYDIPWKSHSLETFTAKDCPLTQKRDNDLVLLAMSEQAYFVTISPESPPSLETILTVALPQTTKTPSVSFDKHTGTFFQLSKKDLSVLKPNQIPQTFRLPQRYEHVHPLSQSYVLLTNSTNLIIYDIIYGTVQANLTIQHDLITVVTMSNPLTPSAILNSDSQTCVLPITIPQTATLLAAISKDPAPPTSHHNKHPLILLAPKLKQKFSKKTLSAVTKQLFESLKVAADSSDTRKFDKLFKEFRGTYRVYRRGPERRRTRLTPQFVKELLALIFVRGGQKLAVRIFPEQTVKFLLDVDAFSKDLVPGGPDGFVGAVVGHKKLLSLLLEKEPTVFRYEDYLILIKYTLETPETSLVIPAETILDAFERDSDTFFERTDMKKVLSLDQLQQLIALLTNTPDMISYPTILCNTLDSIGLASLLLNPTLPADLIETLHTTIEAESDVISTCLTTSSLLSLVLQRQNDVPVVKGKDRAILFNDRKRRLSQTGWVEVVAEEGGLSKQRRVWMKKPPLPGSGKEMTHRFVATSKFQEVPNYSLDRMIME